MSIEAAGVFLVTLALGTGPPNSDAPLLAAAWLGLVLILVLASVKMLCRELVLHSLLMRRKPAPAAESFLVRTLARLQGLIGLCVVAAALLAIPVALLD